MFWFRIIRTVSRVFNFGLISVSDELMSKKVGSRKRLNSTSTDFDSLLPKWPCIEPYSLTDPLGLEKVKKDVEGSEKRNKTNESGRPKRRRNSSFSHGSKRVKSKSAEKSRNTDDEEAAKQSTLSASKKYKRLCW